ncbi:hypothetical protein LCM10_12405 [Rossellomorea aquimaris]|uniref:lipoprotein n=1 Tax=Rossellomorea aquimaris TaxID=189382 RepID=UPI001CD6E381|nr:lipoprotein [Rossellomorea aquimaris]MCA1055790.1 hypothetical protein [Rossellomorea aquimaris]
MKKLVLLITLILLLSACQNGKETGYELCGDGPMMVVDGKGYLQMNVSKKVTLGTELGQIKKRIDSKYHPVENHSSNTLESGSTIYSVKGETDYLVAKTNDDRYVLFQLIAEH